MAKTDLVLQVTIHRRAALVSLRSKKEWQGGRLMAPASLPLLKTFGMLSRGVEIYERKDFLFYIFNGQATLNQG